MNVLERFVSVWNRKSTDLLPWLACPVFLLFASAVSGAQDLAWLDDYTIEWDSQSSSSAGSMPLGGGELGLNVWAENADVLFYIGSPDSFDEDAILRKLGRIRLTFTPNPFAKGFKQSLDLRRSTITIEGVGESDQRFTLELWVDAFKPVIHVRSLSGAAVDCVAAYETWVPQVKADAIGDGDLQWYYRHDPARDRRAGLIKAQKLEALADLVPDPSTNLTFGGRLTGPGLVAAGEGQGEYVGTPYRSWKVRTHEPVTELDLRVVVRIAQDKTIEDWESQLARLRDTTADSIKADREATLEWWRKFWARSHIVVKPPAGTPDPEQTQAWRVGRNYQLFRYMLACNRTGKFPTLFNGGIFTTDGPLPDGWKSPVFYWEGGRFNPDERAWPLAQFYGQNQRLLYWPLIKSGDFDVIQPGLDLYRDAAPISYARTKEYWGIDGAIMSEGLSWYGLINPWNGFKDGHPEMHCLSRHYTSTLEFAYMMVEHCRYTGRDIRSYLPVIEGLVHYYDQYYRKLNKERTGEELSADGKLVISPSSALEIAQFCTDNTDVITGLMALTDGLLCQPEGILDATKREFYRQFKQRIPPIPTREFDGHEVIAIAREYEIEGEWYNMELPQLYSVFPFDRFGLGRPDLELARDTWRYGAELPDRQKNYLCWFQCGIFLARLGLTEESRSYCVRKFLHPDAPGCLPAAFPMRFPAFLNTYNFDHPPCMDGAGSAMIHLQEMLMQAPPVSPEAYQRGERGKILLTPAWPADWDCEFKLRAPYQTTVEGHVTDGKVVVTRITPESRRNDVKIIPLQPVARTPVSMNQPATASTEYSPDYSAAKAVDGKNDTRWSMSSTHGTGWLEVDLGKPTEVARAVLIEKSYPQITSFAIEMLTADGQWQVLARGRRIGAWFESSFAPVTGQKFRLHVLESRLKWPDGGVTVDEFQLFAN